jgi:hypothetical protein
MITRKIKPGLSAAEIRISSPARRSPVLTTTASSCGDGAPTSRLYKPVLIDAQTTEITDRT